MFGAPVITIVNQSPHNIFKLVLTGVGFQRDLAILHSGEKQVVIVHLKGDSGLQLQFEANGKEYYQDDLAYLQGYGGYCVTLQIKDDLKVQSLPSPFCASFERINPF
jgi:hypothetical protein